MIILEDQLKRIRLCAKPILFETGFEEVPYGGAGTTFFVKVGSTVLLVSSRHAFGNYPLEKLLVFPNAETDNSIPFNKAFSVANRDQNDPDFSDIVLARVDLNKIHLATESNMVVLDLDKASDIWREAPSSQKYFIFGYPNERSNVDYEECKIFNNQSILVGNFIGASPSSYCFELKIIDSNGVLNFNGLSGSPVVSIPYKPKGKIDISFCGMVIRGTSPTSPIHFLDAKVIRHAISLAIGT